MNVRVERLGPGDAGELYAAIVRSRGLHKDWVTPPRSVEELRIALAQSADNRASYGVRTETDELAGVVNLTSMIRGPFQSCFLGYFALTPFQGRGYMKAGLPLVVDLAFGQHGLHRVEATVQPGNVRSARLLQRLGFRLEGHSPRYLLIAGEWRDHDHYAMTVEEWPDSAARLREQPPWA
jgi:ribosomal-protein-alanine N-acetyltransferase